MNAAGQLRETLDARVGVMVGAAIVLAALVLKEGSIPSMMLLAGVAACGLGFVRWGWRSPELGLYALIAYIPFSRIMVGDFGLGIPGFNLTNLLTAWLLLTCLLAYRANGRVWLEMTPLHGVLLGFIALYLFALVRAAWAYGGWYFWDYLYAMKQILAPMAFFFLAFWIVRDIRTIKTVAALLMTATVLIALISVWDYLTRGSGDLNWVRVRTIAREPNVLGTFFVTYLFLYAGFFLTLWPSRRGWLMLIPLLACARGIMVTFSRGAYLACVAGGLTIAWVRSKRLFLAVLALLILAIANPALLPAGIRYRLEMTLERHEPIGASEPLTQRLDPSATNRIKIWRGALAMIQEHRWWGVGFGAFPKHVGYYSHGEAPAIDAHNLYLLYAAEMGIPTLLVYLLLLLMALHYAVRLYRLAEDPAIQAIALGVSGGIAAWAGANFFTFCMDAQEAVGYFWILLALVMRGLQLTNKAST
ncbi:MAG: O-antigen ligase family protein [Candidatus Omnitrophica bacterium]|nr:O-antigen ligase family protein [Candidatus Omnitrophota bacterium]